MCVCRCVVETLYPPVTDISLLLIVTGFPLYSSILVVALASVIYTAIVSILQFHSNEKFKLIAVAVDDPELSVRGGLAVDSISSHVFKA